MKLFSISLSAVLVAATMGQLALAAPNDFSRGERERGDVNRGSFGRGEFGREDRRDPRERYDREDRRDPRDRYERDDRRDPRDRNDRDERGGRGQMSREQARQLVRLMYRAILFREGEQSGVQAHASYIEQNGERSVVEVAANIASSPEFRQNVLPRYTPRQIVENIYAVFFQRQLDPSGRDTWVPMVRQGRASDALRGITGSEEFRRLYFR